MSRTDQMVSAPINDPGSRSAQRGRGKAGRGTITRKSPTQDEIYAMEAAAGERQNTEPFGYGVPFYP